MQRVLNTPVPADCPDQDGGIIVATCQEVADLGLDRAGAVDAPDRLDGQNRTQVRPAMQGLEVLDRWGHEDAPAPAWCRDRLVGVEEPGGVGERPFPAPGAARAVQAEPGPPPPHPAPAA